MPLEEHYSGDKNWKDFVLLHMEKPMSGEKFFDEEDKFLSFGTLNEDGVELLVVAVSIFGVDRTISWLEKKIPALDSETPIDCIKASQVSDRMKKRMREYLMRVPV